MPLLGSRLSWESIVAGSIALGITLALFFGNRSRSGSTFQGIMMTVWQLFVGLVMFLILVMLDNGKKRGRKSKRYAGCL